MDRLIIETTLLEDGDVVLNELPFEPGDTVQITVVKDDWHCKKTYPQLKALSEWAVDSRYPGVSEEPSEAQSKEAYSQAEGILESIKQTLIQRGLSLEK